MIQLGLCWGRQVTNSSFQRRHGYKNKIFSDHLETIFTDKRYCSFNQYSFAYDRTMLGITFPDSIGHSGDINLLLTKKRRYVAIGYGEGSTRHYMHHSLC